MTPSNRALWLIFGLLGLIWGSSYLFIKIGVESLGPFTLVSLRVLFAAAFLTLVVLATRQPLPREWRVLRHLLVLGLLSIFFPFSLITFGEIHVSSGAAAVLNATVPLFTILIAAVMLRDDPITMNRVIGLVIGFVGVGLLVAPSLGGPEAGDDLSLAGQIAITLSSVSYALGAVYARRFVQGLPPVVIALGMVTVGFLVSAPLAFLLERPFSSGIRPEALFGVAWLGILGSGVALLIFYRLIANWGPTRTHLVNYLIPPIGVALGVLVLGESLDPSLLLGTALIIGGVSLVNARQGIAERVGRLRRGAQAAD